MKKNSLRILIVGQVGSDTSLERQLKQKAQDNFSQVSFFDKNQFPIDDVFNSSYSHEFHVNNFSPETVFNADSGQQLASALIQEYERRNESHTLLFHDNLHTNQILWSFIQNYLTENRIDTVVFLHPPQELIEVVLYQVSQALDKETFILRQTIFNNRFFSYRALNEFGNYENPIQSTGIGNQDIESNFQLHNHPEESVNSQEISLHKLTKVILFLLKIRSVRLFNPMYIVRSARNLHHAPENVSDWRDPFAKFFSSQKIAYFEYLTFRLEYRSILKQRFIYFPLQSFKELSMESLFNRYSDQLLAIEQLARLIPNDCKIVVRDDCTGHPDYLTPMFFHRINRISKVVRVPRDVDSEELLSQCVMFATINSHQGWNALKLGKKCLVFGKPWYWKLPGVCFYRNSLSYEEILESNYDSLALNDQFNVLFSRSHVGRLPIHSNSCYDNDDENAKNVAQTICDLVFNRVSTTF